MGIARLRLFALVLVGNAVLFGSPGWADETGAARVAAPERIRAGDAFLGAGRYYPSPVLYDVDGDQRLDIVVGDLMGRVTVARRWAGKAPAFLAEKPLPDRDGKPLRFHNW